MTDKQDVMTKSPRKKSVALSGVTAGQTAICTVGANGKELHYRGYDIHDLAEYATFEEVAHLLIHEELPNPYELSRYLMKLETMRGLPAPSKLCWNRFRPRRSQWTCCVPALRYWARCFPSERITMLGEARNAADRLLASFPTMLVYWYHYARNGKRIETDTGSSSVAEHFLHLLEGHKPPDSFVRALDVSLILYAEHEFNASTFTSRVISGTGSDIYSAVTGAIGALRGYKHGGANEGAFELIQRFRNADEAEEGIQRMLENKEIILGFGHPVYTVSDPRSDIIKAYARQAVRRIWHADIV
jgi:2-methylcitrate synthase